jgi:hypothetical protein
MLPALLDALITAAEAQVARVVESGQAVTSFISTVKKQRAMMTNLALKDYESEAARRQADSVLEELRQEDDAAALRTFQALPSMTDYDSAVNFFVNNPGKLAKGVNLAKPRDLSSIRVLASIKDAADFFRTVAK